MLALRFCKKGPEACPVSASLTRMHYLFFSFCSVKASPPALHFACILFILHFTLFHLHFLLHHKPGHSRRPHCRLPPGHPRVEAFHRFLITQFFFLLYFFFGVLLDVNHCHILLIPCFIIYCFFLKGPVLTLLTSAWDDDDEKHDNSSHFELSMTRCCCCCCCCLLAWMPF